jgi:hypothetical protein
MGERPPVLFPHPTGCYKSLVLYVRGFLADGEHMASVLRQCCRNYNDNDDGEGDDDRERGSGGIERLEINRKDNDWEAPEAAFHLLNEEAFASALEEYCPNLLQFYMTGIISPIGRVCRALGNRDKLPHLRTVSFRAEPHFSTTMLNDDNLDNASSAGVGAGALLSSQDLRMLLQSVSQRLSLVGVFPETKDYRDVLHEAFVERACRTHLFFHFGRNKHHLKQQFAYFLRDVMELNQKGRRSLSSGGEW